MQQYDTKILFTSAFKNECESKDLDFAYLKKTWHKILAKVFLSYAKDMLGNVFQIKNVHLPGDNIRLLSIYLVL